MDVDVYVDGRVVAALAISAVEAENQIHGWQQHERPTGHDEGGKEGVGGQQQQRRGALSTGSVSELRLLAGI